MGRTEADLDRMINEVFDEKLNAVDEIPYVCGMLRTKHGRERIFKAVKKMILEQGETDIEAILAQFEDAHDWNN
jgi:hypothetical protein